MITFKISSRGFLATIDMHVLTAYLAQKQQQNEGSPIVQYFINI